MESFNFKLCPDAAKELFDYVQEKKIKTTVVSSMAVKELKMDYSCLDALKKSKNPVVKALFSLKDEHNPTTMAYDMVSAMCLVDGVFKAGGGVIEKEDEGNISFARIAEPKMMLDKFCEIFKEKLEPKTISLEHLRAPKTQYSTKDEINA